MGRAVVSLLFLLSVVSPSFAGPTVSTPQWFDEGTLGLGGSRVNCVGAGIVCGFNVVTGKMDITVAAGVAGEANSLANNGTDCVVGEAARGIDTVGNGTGCFAVHPLMTESAPCPAGQYITNWDIDGTITCSAPTAAQVVNTPAGTIAATNMQAVVAELDDEKQPLDAELTSLAGKTIAGDGTTVRLSTGAFTANDCVKVDAAGNFATNGSACGSGGGGGGSGDALVANPLSQFAATTPDQLDSVLAGGTGSGDYVRATGPTLSGPNLGIPASGVMTNVTGLPIATGVSGLGAGVATALTTPTVANFNTMLSNGDFATTAGTETLTNKTLTTPAIVDFTNASHDHLDADDGGVLSAAAVTSGQFAMARLAMGTPDGTQFIRDDGFLAVPPGSVPQGLQDVVTVQRRVTDAVDLSSCVGFGGLTHYVCIYGNASEGAVLAVSPAQDLTWTLAATKDFFFKAADGSIIAGIDNDTETFSLLNPLALASGGTGQATAQLAINALTGVAAATDEQCLMKDTGTGNATFKACNTQGDVEGPGTATDNAVAAFDGTTGALLKNSLVTIDPVTGNITTPGTVSAGAGGSGGGGWVFTEGTAPSAPAANTIQVYAPVDVTTAYGIALPASSATGFLLGTNAANVNTMSFIPYTGLGDVMRGTAPTFATYADLTEATARDYTGGGVQRFYAKTGAALCGKNSAGTETCMGSVTGGSFTLANLNTAVSDADVATLTGAESLTNKKLGSLTTNGDVKTTGGDGTLSVVVAPTLTVTRPMKMSTISVSNANAFVDTIDGTNFDYSAVRFVDAAQGDTFWTFSVPPGVAATPAWNVIVTSKAVSGAGANVVLDLSCKAFATNVAFDAALTSLQAQTVYAISTSANTTITTLNGTNYDATAPIAAGNFLVCKLSREGAHASDSSVVDWLVLDVSIRLDVNVGT